MQRVRETLMGVRRVWLVNGAEGVPHAASDWTLVFEK